MDIDNSNIIRNQKEYNKAFDKLADLEIILEDIERDEYNPKEDVSIYINDIKKEIDRLWDMIIEYEKKNREKNDCLFN